jgi:hypothetical protein
VTQTSDLGSIMNDKPIVRTKSIAAFTFQSKSYREETEHHLCQKLMSGHCQQNMMISFYNNEEKFNNLVIYHRSAANFDNNPWSCPMGMDQIY